MHNARASAQLTEAASEYTRSVRDSLAYSWSQLQAQSAKLLLLFARMYRFADVEVNTPTGLTEINMEPRNELLKDSIYTLDTAMVWLRKFTRLNCKSQIPGITWFINTAMLAVMVSSWQQNPSWISRVVCSWANPTEHSRQIWRSRSHPGQTASVNLLFYAVRFIFLIGMSLQPAWAGLYFTPGISYKLREKHVKPREWLA